MSVRQVSNAPDELFTGNRQPARMKCRTGAEHGVTERVMEYALRVKAHVHGRCPAFGTDALPALRSSNIRTGWT